LVREVIEEEALDVGPAALLRDIVRIVALRASLAALLRQEETAHGG